MIRRSKQTRLIHFSYLITVFASAASGCQTSPELFCQKILPEARIANQNALASLAPWTLPVDKITGRNIATAKKVSATALSSRDREAWKTWGSQRTDQVDDLQNAIEGTATEKQIRPTLNALGNDLVFLQGFADQGDALGIARTLAKIEDHFSALERNLCALQSTARSTQQ